MMSVPSSKRTGEGEVASTPRRKIVRTEERIGSADAVGSRPITELILKRLEGMINAVDVTPVRHTQRGWVGRRILGLMI